LAPADFRQQITISRDGGSDVAKTVKATKKRVGGECEKPSKNAEPAKQERREMARWTNGRGLNQSTKEGKNRQPVCLSSFESSFFTLQEKQRKNPQKKPFRKRRMGSRSTEKERKGKVRGTVRIVEASQKKRRTNRKQKTEQTEQTENRKQATQKTETKPIQKQQKAETAAAESNDSTNERDRVRILFFCMCCCV
jgi:hypothetical protein